MDILDMQSYKSIHVYFPNNITIQPSDSFLFKPAIGEQNDHEILNDHEINGIAEDKKPIIRDLSSCEEVTEIIIKGKWLNVRIKEKSDNAIKILKGYGAVLKN